MDGLESTLVGAMKTIFLDNEDVAHNISATIVGPKRAIGSIK